MRKSQQIIDHARPPPELEKEVNPPMMKEAESDTLEDPSPAQVLGLSIMNWRAKIWTLKSPEADNEEEVQTKISHRMEVRGRRN